ncbi:hypothetical protein IT409_02080 [Candidatus Falkowbacteria bacterium]|nr:hypothetical protein [Candidatus Falkowbacteria bacterium]
MELTKKLPKAHVISFLVNVFGKTVPALIELLDEVLVTKKDYVNRTPMPSARQVEYFFDRHPFFLKAFSDEVRLQSVFPLASRVDLYQEILTHPSFTYLNNRYPMLDVSELVKYLDEVKSGFIRTIANELDVYESDAKRLLSSQETTQVIHRMHAALTGLSEEEVNRKDVEAHVRNFTALLS